MNYISIINKYYTPGTKLYHILLTHSRSVADKALSICKNHPELNIDVQFVEEAAMLHDIGIFRTNAPGIECYGDKPYICHGTIGAELLRNEGFPHHALVAERHTGAGISHEEIIKQKLPIPLQDYLPISIEEQLICYADKFYSKTHLDREKTLEQARKSLIKFGQEGLKRFDYWSTLFG